jgi:hypothetical protein
LGLNEFCIVQIMSYFEPGSEEKMMWEIGKGRWTDVVKVSLELDG